jgi:hypothetical protein
MFADAIMADERLFDRLVAYDRAFHKFARVVADERVACRLTLTDLASMAGVPGAVVLEIANGQKPAASVPPAEPAYTDSRISGPHQFDEDSLTVDVRSDLDRGQEPLAAILDAVADLEEGKDLVVETTFHAVPLRRLLGRRGFGSFAEQLADEHWRIRFRKSPASNGACCGGQCGGRR